MSDRTHFDDSLDPEVLDLLNLLRETPPRDPKAMQSGRARYLAELDTLFETHTPAAAHPERRGRWLNLFRKSKEETPMTRSFAFTTVLALIAVFALLFGGARVTSAAAQSALPGDALYPVKTGLENTQMRLTSDAARQASLYLSFAERRLDEINGLISAGRFYEIDQAAQEFEVHVQNALLALQKVSAEDPARASELAVQITATLTRYATELNGMLNLAPETARPAMKQALQASQSAGSQAAQDEIELTGKVETMDAQSWRIDGRSITLTAQTEIKGTIQTGDLVKVHAFIDASGNLVAREIEPALAGVQPGIDDNGNDNAGMDDHGDDNGALNENGDDHGSDRIEDNANASGNENGDDHGNDNGAFDDHGDNDDNSGSQNSETRFTGVVQTTGSAWTVAGIDLIVNEQTLIEGSIQTGDMVEVRAEQAANGELIALRLRLVDDNSGSSASSGSGGRDDNSRTGSSNSSLDDNSNTSSNTNTSGGVDDHGGDSGSGSGGSGGGHGGNSNGSNDNSSGGG